MIRTGTNRHRAVAVRPDGTVVELVVYAYGDAPPHDLVHFAVESALGLEWGFWGLLAAGATFDALAEVGTHGRPPAGDATLVAEHVADLLAAEALANGGFRDHAEAVAAVEAIHAQWQTVAVGGKLRLTWPAADIATRSRSRTPPAR